LGFFVDYENSLIFENRVRTWLIEPNFSCQDGNDSVTQRRLGHGRFRLIPSSSQGKADEFCGPYPKKIGATYKGRRMKQGRLGQTLGSAATHAYVNTKRNAVMHVIMTENSKSSKRNSRR
jgi:hypothetical protein